MDDAWNAARKICLGKEDGGISNGELLEIFKVGSDYSALKKYSASEAVTMLRDYERQKADKIKVGNEVKSLITGRTYIIYEIDGKVVKGYNFESQDTCCSDKNDCFKKTGRHFPQITELIEAMKGEQRNCSTCWYDDGNGVPQCTGCSASKGYNMWKPKEYAE